MFIVIIFIYIYDMNKQLTTSEEIWDITHAQSFVIWMQQKPDEDNQTKITLITTELMAKELHDLLTGVKQKVLALDNENNDHSYRTLLVPFMNKYFDTGSFVITSKFKRSDIMNTLKEDVYALLNNKRYIKAWLLFDESMPDVAKRENLNRLSDIELEAFLVWDTDTFDPEFIYPNKKNGSHKQMDKDLMILMSWHDISLQTARKIIRDRLIGAKLQTAPDLRRKIIKLLSWPNRWNLNKWVIKLLSDV